MSEHNGDQLETALRQLKPTPPTFEKDRLVFLAGQASGRRGRWRLALLTALIGVGTGIVGAYVGVRSVVPAEITKVVVIQVPVPAAIVPETPKTQEPPPLPSAEDESPSSGWASFFPFARPTSGYLQQRDQMLRWGIEAIPTAAPTGSTGPAPRQKSFLEMRSELIGNASEF